MVISLVRRERVAFIMWSSSARWEHTAGCQKNRYMYNIITYSPTHEDVEPIKAYNVYIRILHVHVCMSYMYVYTCTHKIKCTLYMYDDWAWADSFSLAISDFRLSLTIVGLCALSVQSEKADSLNMLWQKRTHTSHSLTRRGWANVSTLRAV